MCISEGRVYFITCDKCPSHNSLVEVVCAAHNNAFHFGRHQSGQAASR